MQVKTDIIESIYHSQNMSELRLNTGRVYTANLRLGNLGCVSDSETLKLYNSSSGVYSLIKNIYLYDGNQLLDQILDAHHLFAFRNLLNKGIAKNINAYNYNIGQQLVGLSNAYQDIKDSTDTDLTPELNYVEQIPVDSKCFVTNDKDTTFKGWMNLENQFSFLRSLIYSENGQQMQYVDTNVFRNFRIVIEWRSTAELNSCFQGTTTNIKFNILSPQLYCDEVIGLSLPQQLTSSYLVYEVDKMYCPPTVAQVASMTKARLNAFNGKNLQKILMMNIEPTQLKDDDPDNRDIIKCDGSVAYENEVLQLVVNGKTLFDFNGIDSDARKLIITTDTWGDLNIPLGSYNSTISDNDSENLDAASTSLLGRISYVGCQVQQRIVDFTVEHSRTSQYNDKPSMFIYVWGEVVKQIQISGGQYVISYA